MADKENRTVAVARPANKRAAAATPHHHHHLQSPAKKRHVVLGELSNLPTAVDRVPAVESQKLKRNAKEEEEEEEVKGSRRRGVGVKADNPQMCGSHVGIYPYLRSMEVESKRRPLPNYIEEVQEDVTANMRGILVDWLVEFADEYKLVTETLYLAISYIDRYLSVAALNRHSLQLLGVSSMLLASKYEETSPLHVEDLCYVSDNNYSKEEVVSMETAVLKLLDYEIGNPTIKTFLRRFDGIAPRIYKTPNLKLEFLGSYLAELCLLDYACVKFLPSLVAASVTFLSRFTIRPKLHPWSSRLQQYSGYKPSDLRECVLVIHGLQLSARGSSLQAVREKYKRQKFKCVAYLSSPPEIPASYFENLEEL